MSFDKGVAEVKAAAEQGGATRVFHWIPSVTLNECQQGVGGSRCDGGTAEPKRGDWPSPRRYFKALT